MNNQFKGGFTTQNHEIAVEDLVVDGNIPQWLVGVYDEETDAQIGTPHPPLYQGHNCKDRSLGQEHHYLVMLVSK
jgi:carotenoid cleavage dioxygenase-like enzyme